MENKNFETLVGAAILVAAIIFSLLLYRTSYDVSDTDSYIIHASFGNIDGIVLGNDVKISGVKVGSVSSYSLDEDTYDAVVDISIYNDIKIPMDSSASIVSSGLLGSKYISITPGMDDALVKQNDYITFTQSSVNLEALLGKVIFNSGDTDSNNDETNTKLEE